MKIKIKRLISEMKIKRTVFTVIVKQYDKGMFIGYINGKDFNNEIINYLLTEHSPKAKEVLIINKNKKLGLSI